jgi:hypothetical protein
VKAESGSLDSLPYLSSEVTCHAGNRAAMSPVRVLSGYKRLSRDSSYLERKEKTR